MDITIDGLSVVDKFEWDLGETRNSPEDFATNYAKELALPSQFMYIKLVVVFSDLTIVLRLLMTFMSRCTCFDGPCCKPASPATPSPAS